MTDKTLRRDRASDDASDAAYWAGVAPSPSSHGGDPLVVHYAQILYRRRYTVLAALFLVTTAALVWSFVRTPVYEARALIVIEPDNPNIVSFKEVLEQDSQTADYYQTQYRILQSRLLARKTIESLNLWQQAEIGEGRNAGQRITFERLIAAAGDWVERVMTPRADLPGADETAQQAMGIDAFLRRLTVTPVRNSRLVEIRYESADSKLAARVANMLARCYIDQTLEFKFLASKQATDWLARQLDEQRKLVADSEAALQQYRQQGDAVALEDRQNIVVQRLADLNAAVTRARTERMQKEALFRRLQAIQDDPAAIDTFPAINASTFIQQLKVNLSEVQRQQADLGEKLGDKHPEMTKIKSAVQAAEMRLQAEIAKVVGAVENEYLAALTQEQSLVSALEKQKTEALALDQKGIGYGVLRREADSNRQIYETLLQRAKETGLSSQLRTSNIRVVDEADVPRRPSRPNRGTDGAFGLLVGLIFGVGLAFVFEHVDSRITTPDEIKDHLGLQFLGLIPKAKTSARHEALKGIPPHFVESFRALVTNVLFHTTELRARTIAVTSTKSGEGKTLVSANVAMSLAEAGRRVLLMDGDMRRPHVHDVMGLERQPGLSNLLHGTAKPSEAVRPTSVRNLWVLPAGGPSSNAAKLLASERFTQVLATLADHFDWIVVDTPPVIAVADPSIVANRAGGVLFVVGCHMTQRATALQAIEQLRSARANVLGGVLNRADLRRDPYYYSRYYQPDDVDYYRETRLDA